MLGLLKSTKVVSVIVIAFDSVKVFAKTGAVAVGIPITTTSSVICCPVILFLSVIMSPTFTPVESATTIVAEAVTNPFIEV